MKALHTLLSCFGLLLLSLSGHAQCANQITVTYFDGGVRINNGQSGGVADVCPSAGAEYTFSGSSTSDAVLTWTRVVSRGNTSATDVVVPVSTVTGLAGTIVEATVAPTTTTEYRLQSNADAYPGSNCSKNGYAYFTFAPALTLSAPNASLAGICGGTSTTLTAAGATSGNYAWTANGVTIPSATGASLTVTPTATTIYTVTATTSCGTSSQQLTIPVKDVTIAPSAPVVCANQSTTLTATYTGTSATYQWFQKGQSTVLSSASGLTVTPAVTTTYQVVATTAECNTITREVTVSVGAAGLRIAPTAVTICTGGATSLTAISENPGATYAWSPGTGLSGTTGATVTASPTATTTYTVTATTPCGATTSQVEVTVVAAPAYAVTPASAAVCGGDATTLTASSGITNTTYRWYRTTDLGTILSSAAALTVAPSTNTTYRVVTTTSCGTNTQDVPVTVSARPVVGVTPTATTVVAGSTTTLNASGASTYAWTATVDGNTTALPNTTASISVSPQYTTTYTVTGTGAGGCQNTARSTVSVTRPLPVALIGFEAVWAGKAPLLTWATAAETNSAYFDIERSLDGEKFEAVGRRRAAGSTTARTTYEFADAGLVPAAALVYYRLRQVDVSGEAYYSPVRALRVAAAAFSAAVYPNPYDQKVAVQFLSSGPEAVTLIVRNVLGQNVLTQTAAGADGMQEVSLPAAGALPRGLYYLTIRQGSHQQVLRMSRE